MRLCIGCNDACVIQTNQGKPIRCVVNPAAGRELGWSERLLERADEPRSVVVVGGGPGGLKAAETAARCGHRVTLLERDDALGGQVRLAARQPLHGEILDTVLHLERELDRLGVDVRLGTQAGAQDVLALAPDAVVVATGSLPGLPRARTNEADDGRRALALGRQVAEVGFGLDQPHVRASDECYGPDAPAGGRVLVVDGTGHWETIGTAELLAERGCAVEVIAARPLVGTMCDSAGRALWHQRAIERDITVSPNVELLEVVPGGARVLETLSGRERLVEADVVVPVVARRSCEELYLELSEALPDGVHLERVGDCVAPRLLQHAVAEGYAAGRAITAAVRGADVPAPDVEALA